MRNGKKVLSRSSETWINCAWCQEKQGFELHKSVRCEHPVEWPCAVGEHINFIFCTDRHKQYFEHSTRHNGQLPPGYKRAII